MNKEEIIGLTWWARQRVRGFMTGLHKSPDFGFSLDFAQHREYVPGDSPKFIDWTVLARQDKFLTKQFEAESNLRAYFLLDSSSSMYGEDGERWDYAVRQIALSAALLSKQRDALGLLDVREEDLFFFQAKNTDEAVEQILYHIAERSQSAQNNGDLEGAVSMLLSEIAPRSEVLFLTDPYHENLELLCERLGAFVDAGHYVKILMLVSKERELQPSYYAGEFVRDSENGMKTVLSAQESKSLNDYIEKQLETVKNSAASFGLKSNVLFIEDEPLFSFSKLLEP